MNLDIAGRTALISGASKGLGKACAMALAAEGVLVTIIARGKDDLEQAAEDIRRETDALVHTVVCDVTTKEGQELALAATPHVDILVTNAGGPPPGNFHDWRRDDWIRAVDANMIAPIELIRRTVDGMIQRRFGRVINITSSAVKAPIAFLGLSNAARRTDRICVRSCAAGRQTQCHHQ